MAFEAIQEHGAERFVEIVTDALHDLVEQLLSPTEPERMRSLALSPRCGDSPLGTLRFELETTVLIEEFSGSGRAWQTDELLVLCDILPVVDEQAFQGVGYIKAHFGFEKVFVVLDENTKR